MNFKNGRFRILSIFLGAVIFGLSTITASACEISMRAWPGLFHYLIEPSDGHYNLIRSDAPNARITARYSDLRADGSRIGSSKRLKIVSGHTLEIDQVRDAKNAAKVLMFRSKKGEFDGSFSLSSDERVTKGRFTINRAKMPNVLIETYYDEPRPVPMALEDMICAYEQVPILLEADQ